MIACAIGLVSGDLVAEAILTLGLRADSTFVGSLEAVPTGALIFAAIVRSAFDVSVAPIKVALDY